MIHPLVMKAINETTFFKAVENNELNELMVLLDVKGVNVNAEDHHQKTPLHYASYNGNKEIVSFIETSALDQKTL